MPKVSVIVPVYNIEKYIGRCIESIQKQTLEDWELILVDDCGSDDSMEVVKKYAEKDSRIKFIESEKNVGPMVAREKGYEKSTGDYIAFVDGDDTLVYNALDTLYSNAIKCNADIVSGGIVRIRTNNTKLYSAKNNCEGVFNKKDIFYKLLKDEFAHNLCAKLFRGELIRDIKYKNIEGIKNGEDAYLFYQIVEKSKIIVSIRNVVYEYWMIDTSSSHKRLTLDMVRSMALFSKYQKDVFEKELGAITFDFYKILYPSIADKAKEIPVAELVKIYNGFGIELDLSFSNLMHYMSFLEAIKCFVRIHLYRKMKKMLVRVL